MATTFRNRREKRTYWKQAMRAFVKNVVQDDLNPGSTIFMKKYLARPPGCSFLGAKATTVSAHVGGVKDGVLSSLIIDSGSDITLISHKLLNSLPKAPRICWSLLELANRQPRHIAWYRADVPVTLG